MVKCKQSGCDRKSTHYSANTTGFVEDMAEYVKYCEKHAKIRWINGYHMVKIDKND